MVGKIKIATLLLVTAAAIAPEIAVAQRQNNDVVIMRRVIAPPRRPVNPNPNPAPEMTPLPGADLNGTYWVVSGWFAEQDACTPTSEQARLRGCVYRGEQVADENCPSPAPELTRIVPDYNGCTYDWEVTGYGEWASQCSTQTSRPITSVCMRKDGQISSDELCSENPKPVFQNGSNLEGCTYRWEVGEFGDWQSQCSDNTMRTRSVVCKRSDEANAAGSFCPQPAPNTIENGANYANCEFKWVSRAWGSPTPACSTEATRFRTNYCVNANGTEVPRTFCDGLAEPATSEEVENLEGCQYEWKTTPFSEWSSTCSDDARRTRLVTCERTDGTVVSSDKCSGEMPGFAEAASITTGCTYGWSVGEWQTTDTCSENSTRIRAVFCSRSDGKTVDDNFCNNADRPDDLEEISDVSGCVYTWEANNWSEWSGTCTEAAVRSRTAQCKRSDDTIVDAGLCDPRDMPVLQDVGPVYTGCELEWAVGEWTEFSSQCSSASRRTREVGCYQIRPGGPTGVRREECISLGEAPIGTEIKGIYTGCENEWSYGPWGWEGVADATSSTCSLDALQTREAVCNARLSDGTITAVPDENCTEPKEPTERVKGSVAGCDYDWVIGDWTPWSSTCSASASRSRTVQCVRRDGNDTVVDGNLCVASNGGSIPENGQTGPNVTDCTGLLRNGGFEQGTFSTADEWTVPVGTAFPTNVRFEGEKSMLISPNFRNLPATQIISTIPGYTYNLSVNFRTSSNFGIVVRANNAAFISVASVPTGGTNVWLGTSGSFVATETTTTIAISRSSTSEYFLYVDNLILTVNP